MTPATLTLTEFLLARIAEEERAARAVESEDAEVQRTHYDRLGVTSDDGRINRVWLTIDPARVLAGCEAKRRIVAADERNRTPLMRDADVYAWTTRVLAAIYADHPDFREEWRP